jgi:uncharacterized membrane protein HdeD (DUF308 family)
MDERILSGFMLIVLSVVFGAYGIWSLRVAYRTGDRKAWADMAIQGALGVLASGIFADLSARFMS